MNSDDLFDSVVRFPDPAADALLETLVGLDDHRDRLIKEALLLVDRAVLEEWSTKHYDRRIAALDVFQGRPPLFLLAGDVGTGKTALARSFGSTVARQSRVSLSLYSLSLSTRGSGAVGEMTRLISRAFREVRDAVGSRAQNGAILLIDEADAIAQSREAAQMHHEDRAGVNALIRGVDEIATRKLPIVVVMCTNRLEAIDPAVRRRAAAVLLFARPTFEQRITVLGKALTDAGFGEDDIKALAEATGENKDRSHGFTYSDLTQRLIPAVVLDAVPDRPLDPERALAVARTIGPTPPFREGNDD